MILKGKKRGSVAPHREHVALPTIALQLARIRVPHWGQANARLGFSSTIRVLDMDWEPYPLPKLRTSPIPQTLWWRHSLRRSSSPRGQGAKTWNDPHTTSHQERMPGGMHVAEHPLS